MAGWNGTGGFSFTFSWTNDAANGIPITASRMDTQFNDAITGFQNCITRDAQGVATANIPFPAGLKVDTLNPYTAAGPVLLSAGQLKFPAVQAPSTNANVLDDYEEGTWTPIDSSGGGLVFVSAFGRYIKTGSGVNFSGVVVYPATADTNSVLIGGLPFTSSNAIAIDMDGGFFTFTDTARTDMLQVIRNATTLKVYGTAGNRPGNDIYSGKSICFSGWYQASA